MCDLCVAEVFSCFRIILKFFSQEIDRIRITTAYDTGDGKEVMLDRLVVESIDRQHLTKILRRLIQTCSTSDFQL